MGNIESVIHSRNLWPNTISNLSVNILISLVALQGLHKPSTVKMWMDHLITTLILSYTLRNNLSRLINLCQENFHQNEAIMNVLVVVYLNTSQLTIKLLKHGNVN